MFIPAMPWGTCTAFWIATYSFRRPGLTIRFGWLFDSLLLLLDASAVDSEGTTVDVVDVNGHDGGDFESVPSVGIDDGDRRRQRRLTVGGQVDGWALLLFSQHIFS